MNWNIIVVIISLAFSMIAMVLAVNVLKRLGGRLKTTVIFLIFTLGVIVLREILSLFNLLQNIFIGFGLRILIAVFILIAVLKIGGMIKAIDGEYGQVLKKEKECEKLKREKKAEKRK